MANIFDIPASALETYKFPTNRVYPSVFNKISLELPALIYTDPPNSLTAYECVSVVMGELTTVDDKVVAVVATKFAMSSYLCCDV